MRKVKNVFKRTALLTLALSLLISVLSVGVYAETTATESTDPVVLGVTMNETRTFFTLRFDREIEAASTSFSGKIKLSKNGGSLSSIPSNSKVTVSGYCMYISLTSSLTGVDNYFSINAGALVGQNASIETPVFDALGPELIDKNPVVLNSSESTITLKFNCEIRGYPDNDSLKNGYISLARNGSTFNEVIPEDDIYIDSEAGEIKIYLSEWIENKNARIRISAGKLQNIANGSVNLADITTPYINSSNTTAMPYYDYTEVSSDRSTVTIYFTSRIKNAYATGVSSTVASSFLKSHILVSRGNSTNYEPLGGEDKLTIGSNYIRIVFNDPITASRNYIKIDALSITDYYGNPLTEDIVTDNITSGTSSSVAKPAYASAFLSSTKKIVIYFTTPIVRSSDITTSELRERIFISRNGGTYAPLTTSDGVTFSDNAMTITLREPLSGSSNRVRINANTLASQTGVLLSTTVTTSALVAGISNDTSTNPGTSTYDTYPEYKSITYDNQSRRVRITFTTDIKEASGANLQEDIKLSRNGGAFQPLSSNDVILISPANAITILLAEPLTGTSNSFRIDGNTLESYDSGYVQKSSITTDLIRVSADGSSESDGTTGNPNTGNSDYSGDVSASLSDDFYTVTLTFDEAVSNNRSSLEDLKSKIQISRNGSFKALSTDDYIRFNAAENALVIILATPADEYNSQIKIASGSLRDSSGATIAKEISTLPLGEAGGNVRAYINGKAVEKIVTSSANGNSVVASVTDSSKFENYKKQTELLIKVVSDKDSAKLDINGDIVDLLKSNNGTVALSLNDATYYIPTNNINAITSSDTLSLTVNNSAATVSQKLSSAALRDAFSIDSNAHAFTAEILSAAGDSFDITHTTFSNKRFLLADPDTEKTAFTVVRVENSGVVVPVPTNPEVVSGVVYLNSKTMVDGNYAAISSSRSLSTLSWVQGPTNALASRLILSNTNGSNINGSEAVTRAETVEILAKTLGILSDKTGSSSFFDITTSDKSFNSVLSTVSYGLISGYPDSTFKPSNKLTRAEAMTIVARAMRFMNGKNVSVSSEMSIEEATNILSKFTDAATVDNWAKVNIAECVQAGVVNGDNKGRLNPKANVTRAELIQLMYNILNKTDSL